MNPDPNCIVIGMVPRILGSLASGRLKLAQVFWCQILPDASKREYGADV